MKNPLAPVNEILTGAEQTARLNEMVHARVMDGKGSMADYCSNLTVAWSVVDRMRARGFYMKLQSPFEVRSNTWNAGFTQHGAAGWNGRPDHRGQADNAPLAICLAAIAAVGGVKGELVSEDDPGRTRIGEVRL